MLQIQRRCRRLSETEAIAATPAAIAFWSIRNDADDVAAAAAADYEGEEVLSDPGSRLNHLSLPFSFFWRRWNFVLREKRR